MFAFFGYIIHLLDNCNIENNKNIIVQFNFMRLRYDMAISSKNIIPQKNIASWYFILTSKSRYMNSYFLEKTVHSVR